MEHLFEDSNNIDIQPRPNCMRVTIDPNPSKELVKFIKLLLNHVVHIPTASD